ncbi:MAG TPA: histidine kinase [Thermoanaerobaculia bacterium]
MFRRPWLLVSAVWIAPAILGAINEVAQRWISREPLVDLPAILFGSGDWLLYAFLTPGVFWIARRWPLARPHWLRHGSLHLAASLLFCAAWAGGGTLLKVAVQPKALWGTPIEHLLRWSFITFPFGVAVYFGVVGTEHAIRYFVEARDREIELARLAEQLAGARLAALQATVNPHFLFNTLNTVCVLVRDGDQRGATRIVEQLSDVLRETLNRHGTNEVPLDHELELVRQYVAIEQARFSDRLQPEFNVDATLRTAAVPSFALQHLVENAIRHGVAKSIDAGRVVIRVRRSGDVLEIAVIDDGPGIDRDPQLAGHGLENTRERLRALYGEGASLTVSRHAPQGTIAILRIPYREMKPDDSDGRG